MAATTMPSINSLVKQLAADFPQFQFVTGDDCRWHPETQTVTYTTTSRPAEILHEVGHACLAHQDFSRDIQLLAMERDAWQYATTTLAPKYAVTITEESIDEALDSYRDWLHARSLCPQCGATGVQSGRAGYRCLACLTTWRVNDARQCALRRYQTKNPAT